MSAAADDSDVQLPTDAEIAAIVANMRVADPSVDNGAFSSLSRTDCLIWLHNLGVTDTIPSSTTDAEVERRLRLALWDSQRIDNYFPTRAFCQSPKINPTTLPSWPDWKKAHPELRSDRIGAVTMDGFKDAERLNSYVFRHFSMSAFTQTENMQGTAMNPPKGIRGAWIGTKAKMSSAALDVTREGKCSWSPRISFHLR